MWLRQEGGQAVLDQDRRLSCPRSQLSACCVKVTLLVAWGTLGNTDISSAFEHLSSSAEAVGLSGHRLFMWHHIWGGDRPSLVSGLIYPCLLTDQWPQFPKVGS